MAKVVITADTESNELVCTVDGQKLDYVTDVTVCHYPETSYCKEKVEFRASTYEQLENGVKKMLYVMASKEEMRSLVISDPQVHSDVQKAISSRIKTVK